MQQCSVAVHSYLVASDGPDDQNRNVHGEVQRKVQRHVPKRSAEVVVAVVLKPGRFRCRRWRWRRSGRRRRLVVMMVMIVIVVEDEVRIVIMVEAGEVRKIMLVMVMVVMVMVVVCIHAGRWAGRWAIHCRSTRHRHRHLRGHFVHLLRRHHRCHLLHRWAIIWSGGAK